MKKLPINLPVNKILMQTHKCPYIVIASPKGVAILFL